MSQSLVKNLLHLVYTTKHRNPWIPLAARERLYANQAGIFKQWDCHAIAIGGVEDHVHALFVLSKNHPLIKIVEEVKKGSSKGETSNAEFCWQSGYAAFSVSVSIAAQVEEYIRNQEKHNQKMTFQNELRILFNRHKVKFDEQYVWD